MTENEQIQEMAREMCDLSRYFKTCQECNEEYCIDDTLCFCQHMAKEIITHDYRKVERGENITKNHPVDEFICSKCGIHLEEWVRVVIDEEADDAYYYEYAFKFCPNCGADMRGKEE